MTQRVTGLHVMRQVAYLLHITNPVEALLQVLYNVGL